MFPIPKITESFIDGVIQSMGWHRYTDKYPVIEGQENADYLSQNDVLELKIFEEEGILKSNRKTKIAALFKKLSTSSNQVNIDIENIPDEIRNEFENLITQPFQTAIKKASKQMRQSAITTGNSGHKIVIAVNNGYSYLDADNFERLFINRCKRDTKSIDYAACITVDYHQGNIDARIFCTTRIHQINTSSKWEYELDFQNAVNNKFEQAMTIMMKDQLNPELWKNRLRPVKDIHFTHDNVSYIREAPFVPDSRFNQSEI